MAEFKHPELDKLPAAAQARIQDILKTTLEKELAATGVAQVSSPVAAHSRSQGAFFSRSKTSDVLRAGDDLIATQVARLDDAAFEKFASRLAQLKSIGRR